MSVTEAIIAFAIEIICGVAGAAAVMWRWPTIKLNKTTAMLTGALGGLGFTLLAALIPGVARFVGQVGDAADATMHGAGGLTLTVLIGVGISGLLGGIMLTIIVGAFKVFRTGT